MNEKVSIETLTSPAKGTDDNLVPVSLWRSRTVVLAGVVGAGLLFFATTTPKSVPSVWLVAGFVVVGAMLYAVLRLILIHTGLEKRLPAPYRRGIYLCGALLPVLLLMMQSIGQLTIRDILTLGGLFLLGAFYVARSGWPARS
jgi:hypothetical protein